MLKTARVASRLGVDARTVAKYVRRGLTKAGFGKRLFLSATKTGRGYQITAAAVVLFRRRRKAWGL